MLLGFAWSDVLTDSGYVANLKGYESLIMIASPHSIFTNSAGPKVATTN